jgi:uncharacterized protein (DUF2342 family)
MDLFRSVDAVASASGDGAIDWQAVAEAAKSGTDPGTLDLTRGDREGYAADVRDARTRIREVAGVDFDVPRTVELQNRHHWIDANVNTFRRVLEPLEREVALPAVFPGFARVTNTGSMAFSLSYLARHVLGQYDPLLLAEAEGPDHALYFLHPNIVRTAMALDVDYPRFRRWIAFHEVTHAAEFGAAPWLSGYLESRMLEAVESLAEGHFERETFGELDVAMTAVEGYAELLMDRAFDDEYDDLRRKVDARRESGGPVTTLIRRLLGLGLKKRQYELGAAFFSHVADERGLEAASVVWEEPKNLPSKQELENPDRWLTRIDP